MHVKAKRMALAGMLAACSAVMLILSSVLETNSLIFIGAASFCVGIAIREWGVRFGMAFLATSVFLNLLIAPNKFYCFTFAAMGLYLWLREWLWEKLAEKQNVKNRTLKLWIGKYVFFNCMYIPAILFFQDLIFVKKITGILWFVILAAGQAALVVYDKVYSYFQGVIWRKMRKKYFS